MIVFQMFFCNFITNHFGFTGGYCKITVIFDTENQSGSYFLSKLIFRLLDSILVA